MPPIIRHLFFEHFPLGATHCVPSWLAWLAMGKHPWSWFQEPQLTCPLPFSESPRSAPFLAFSFGKVEFMWVIYLADFSPVSIAPTSPMILCLINCGCPQELLCSRELINVQSLKSSVTMSHPVISLSLNSLTGFILPTLTPDLGAITLVWVFEGSTEPGSAWLPPNCVLCSFHSFPSAFHVHECLWGNFLDDFFPYCAPFLGQFAVHVPMQILHRFGFSQAGGRTM